VFLRSSGAIGRNKSLEMGRSCSPLRMLLAAAPSRPVSFHSQPRDEKRGYNRGLLLDLREDESVSIQPVWVLWVEGHGFVEQDVSDRSHAHGGARMAGIRCKGGIDLEKP
jgi:hypothetical protein